MKGELEAKWLLDQMFIGCAILRHTELYLTTHTSAHIEPYL